MVNLAQSYNGIPARSRLLLLWAICLFAGAIPLSQEVVFLWWE